MTDQMVMTSVDTELLHAEQKIERATRNAFYEVGLELRHIRDNKLYRYEYDTFENYCMQRWELTARRVQQIIDAATIVDGIGTIVPILPTKESHVRPLLQLKKQEQQVEVWQRVVDNTNGRRITAKLVEAEVQRKIAELDKGWITLTEWSELSIPDQHRLLSEYHHSTKTMNKPNESIEWAMWSWNPVTGCLHNCPYCYAHDIANRFYPQKFEPSFIADRLAAPSNTKVPTPRQIGDIGYKGVFVCSMADLFGKWVPKLWIDAVLKVIAEQSQWTFLLLTKFPSRMADFEYPSNVWLGTTVDKQAAVKRAQVAFVKIKSSGFSGVCWLSVEPMLERLTFPQLDTFDWLVMGGASRSSGMPEYKPPFDDIVHLHNQARAASIPVYQKTNLIPGMSNEQRLREYPQ